MNDSAQRLTDDGSIAAYVLEQVRQADQARAVQALDWLENKLFVRNEQWLQANDVADQSTSVGFTRLQKPTWKKQVTMNLLFDLRRVIVSRIVASQPTWSVIPASSDEEHRDVARVCEQLLKWFWRDSSMMVELIYFAIDMVETGGAFFKHAWDPSAGEPIQADEGALEEMQADGIRAKPKADRMTGDLMLRHTSSFEIFVDPSAKRLKDARWIAQYHSMHIDEVYERWGKRVMPQASAALTGTTFNPVVALNTPQLYATKSCTVLEYWERPSSTYKQGRYYVTASDQVMHKQDDLPGDDLPFDYCPFDADPDMFYGTTPMSFAKTAQRELNQNLSMIVEGRNRSTYGFFLTDSGCHMSLPTGAPMEQVTYEGMAGKPDWIQPQPAAPQIYELNNVFRQMMQLIMGTNDASMGQSSGGDASGRSIMFLTEEANTRLGPTMTLLQDFLKRMAVKMLNTWRDNAHELTYQVIGENGASDIRAFDASKITFKGVDVSIDSALPQNKQARRDQILQFVQAGMITPQTGQKLMEMGDVEAMMGSADLDKQRARSENEKLYNERIMPEQHEDHAIHLETHLVEMKQERWYGAPESSKAMFREHLAQTIFFMQGGAQPPQQGGEAPQGGGPVPQMPDVPAFQPAVKPPNAAASEAQAGEAQVVQQISGTSPMA